MSKMPAKKKSCFQITSVTQAQVMAIGGTDDTESLDDPDESRAENVSSEIYNVSRSEYDPVCDISSSEEALNNIGETEASSVMAPSHIPQVSQLSALSSNPIGDFRMVGVSGSSQGGQQSLGSGGMIVTQTGLLQQQPAAVSTSSQPAPVTSPAPPQTTSTVSCTSRFRVIKLDHGTGEPFRRGRWTCTEFYEKDSEGSMVSRTDSIRHASVTMETIIDRDSGLGHTVGSVVSPATHSGHGLGSMADVSLSASRMHSVETVSQQQQQIHHQNYAARQHSVTASPTQSTFSSSKPSAIPAQQQQQPAVGLHHPAASQSMLPIGQNGVLQPGVHMQMSPNMPALTQSVAYPPQQQQLPMGHHLITQASGLLQNQTEYYQQQQSASMQSGLSSGQSIPVSSLSAGQGPSSLMSTASAGASVPSKVGDVAGGGSVHTGLLQQHTVEMGGVGGSTLQTGNQYTASAQPHGLNLTASGVQKFVVVSVSSSVPATMPTAVPSASSAAMPNVTTSSLPPVQMPHSNPPGALGPQSLFATGFGQIEGSSGRRSEGLLNAHPLAYTGKDLVKPLIPGSLHLSTPTVNSLFGIAIPMDGDEDSASGTNIVAIDNKIEQAMDLVKSHLMYAVREEVEVLKEQIKELFERNSVLERENAVLKSLANSEQLSQLSSQPAASSGNTPPQQGLSQAQPLSQLQAPALTQPQPPQPQLQIQPQPQPQSHPQLQQHPNPQQLQTQPQPQPQLDPCQQLQPNVTSA
ncbi:TSC22 domain family protein 2-like isoform X1 [Genypterus blacodes]|uniref:TSC22 domain family protein 2-like isoform X1 n=1 Tax=Genypterus blacodes TaxID=154954 RepID=UPI003F757A4B